MTVRDPAFGWMVGLGVAVTVLVPLVAACSATGSEATTSPATALEVAPIFGQVLERLKAGTDVPILLPREVPLPESEVYADAEATAQGYAVHLGYVPDCRGTACFIGMFAARRTEGEYYAGEDFEQTVHLADGIEGHYNPVRCAASCGPAVIEWTRDGVRYRFALKAFDAEPDREKEAMVELANSAIAAGDRHSPDQKNSGHGDAPGPP